MDDALWLQVKLPVEDLDAFLKASPFADSTLSRSDESRVHQFRHFFEVPPARYRAGQESLPNARVLNILIDESGPDVVVLYLMWHER